MKNRKSIAIIGAGISGLILAHEIAEICDVTIFEKSRGVGGRMATRYAGEYFFDHGTPFFTARTKKFKKFVKDLVSAGIVDDWVGKVITLDKNKIGKNKKVTDRLWFEPHYVGSPNMNSICKSRAIGKNIILNTQVTKTQASGTKRHILFNQGGEALGEFDFVIATAPPTQTMALLDQFIPKDCFIRSIDMIPQFALMLGFRQKWKKSWIAAKVNNSPINWIYVNSTKPRRDNSLVSLIIGASPEFSIENLEREPKEIGDLLFQELSRLLPIDGDLEFQTGHRWRYALPPNEQEQQIFWRPEIGIGAIGDWCGGQYSPIENAWHAAMTMAAQVAKAI